MKKIFVLIKSYLLFTIIVIVNILCFNLYGSERKISINASSRLQTSQCISGTWTGFTSANWNESTNWCDGQVPTSTTNVIISRGVPQPIISGYAECNNITINLGAILTIADSNTLAVYGNWSNNGSFVANLSTINYCGNDQIISGNGINVYNNVRIGGNGKKYNSTLNFIINGILSIEGPSIVSQTPNYRPNAQLIYNCDFARDSGNEWPANFTSKGGIIIDGLGIITTSSVKTMEESIPLIINAEATLAINEKDIIFKGNFHNYGTFNVTSASITISGTQAQFIDGFTTTGNLIISKTGGTATLTSNVNANEFQTINTGRINLGERLTHTFTGTWQKGNCTVNCGSSTLRLGSGYNGTEGIFIPNSGTVEWFSIDNHNICNLPYNHLIISGTGIKTPIGSIDMTGDLTIHAGAKLQISQSYIRSNYTGRSLIVNGILFVSSNFPSGFNNFDNVGGTIEYNGNLQGQDIKGLNYNNLILSGKYTKTFLDNTSIINNLSIKDEVQCRLSGFACTANTLTLGDYGQVSGTWGGISSGATYVNNTFFIGSSGILTVGKSTITPGLWVGKNSDWSSPFNWSDGIVPTSETDAILSSTGIDPKINNSAACKNLTILYGAILTINNTNNLMVGKDWINKGTFISNTGTVNFNGDNQLVGLGPFYNLTLSNNGIKTISPLVWVNNILSIEGTATVPISVPISSTGTLQYNTSIARITGPEWPTTPTFSKIILANTGEISLSNAKTINTDSLLIKEDATLNINNFNLHSSGVLYLKCGGLNNGSTIKGTGLLTIKGKIDVSNAGNGMAPARILSKMDLEDIISLSIDNGNTVKLTDTDLLVNTMEGGSDVTIDKIGEGTLYINTFGNLGILNIHAGNVIIPVNAEVSISTTAINNIDGLQIQSNENGSGSFITNSALGIGTATVKCFMTSKAWHLVAPPIAAQNIGSFLLANASIPTNQYDERGIRDYDPVLNAWNDFFTNTTLGNLTFGKGYATRVRDSQTHEIVFSGMLKAGSLTVGSLIPDKWNCIGNPYTSAIAINLSGTGTNIENFLTVNALNIDPAYGIYIWDRTDEYNGLSNQYTAISNVPTSGLNFPVQIGQAFMVKMASGKTSVNFTKAMQLHSTALRLKSTEAAWPIIELIASTDSLSSTTVIAFHEGMTNGLDPTYDAGLLSGDSPLEISTCLIVDYGIPFAIQALPDNAYNSTIVPIYIEYSLGGILSFSAKGINLPIGCNAILEDRLNNTFTNLLNQNYTTILSVNTSSTGRFYLHTSYATTSIDKQMNQQSIKAWSDGYNQLCIQGNVGQNVKAVLFDLQGRMIYTCELNSGHYNRIKIPTIQPGMYILHVKEKNLTKAVKVAFMQW